MASGPDGFCHVSGWQASVPSRSSVTSCTGSSARAPSSSTTPSAGSSTPSAIAAVEALADAVAQRLGDGRVGRLAGRERREVGGERLVARAGGTAGGVDQQPGHDGRRLLGLREGEDAAGRRRGEHLVDDLGHRHDVEEPAREAGDAGVELAVGERAAQSLGQRGGSLRAERLARALVAQRQDQRLPRDAELAGRAGGAVEHHRLQRLGVVGRGLRLHAARVGGRVRRVGRAAGDGVRGRHPDGQHGEHDEHGATAHDRYDARMVRALARSRLHYAWVVLAVTFLVMLMAAGFRATPGVFLKPYEDEFGWSPGLVGGGISISLLLYGAGAPFLAALVERLGMRRVCSVALVLVAVASGLTLVMDSPWQFYVLWGVLVGIATGAIAIPLAAIVANRWFATAARAGRGPARRVVRGGAADLPAAAGVARRGLRLAHRLGGRERDGVLRRRAARDRAAARPARAARPASLRRDRRHAAGQAGRWATRSSTPSTSSRWPRTSATSGCWPAPSSSAARPPTA